MSKRKYFLPVVFILGLLSTLNLPVSLAAICFRSRQVSEVYGPADPVKTFRYDVNNLNIKRLDLFIELTGSVSPSFTVGVDNNVGDAVDPTLEAMGIGTDHFFQFTEGATTFTDTAQLTQLHPNRFLLSIEFGSYYNSALCGPKCEAGDPGCTAPLPSAARRQRTVIVTISGLNVTGHLQVNGISKQCIAAPAAGLPAEALVGANPAKAFVDSGASPCPAAKPTDVAFVLDHSGSMNSSAANDTGSAPPTRITVLNQSMGTFFNIWKQAGQFNAGDRAGAVFFEAPAIIRNFPLPTFLVTFTNDPSSNANLNNLINQASAHVIPGSPGTAMGPALQAVYTRCQVLGDTSCSPQAGFDDTSTNFRQIVLFTDGEQNGGPDVIAPVSVDAPLTLSGIELRSHAVPVHTIGTGFVTGTPYNILLQRLSLDTGGTHTFTATPITDMQDAFLNALIDIFRGNTLGLVDYQTGTITNGGAPVERQFLINRSAKRVVFLVSWHAVNPADQNPNAVTMEVFSPGSSTPISVGANTDTGFHHIKNITIPLPSGSHEGLWKVRINENLAGPSQFFHVAALVDEARLEYKFGAVGGNYGTGAPITLQASVFEEGVPVKTLSSVTARLTRPRNALGTLLRNTPVSPADLTGPPDDLFPDPYSRKIFKLMGQPAIRALLEPVTEAQPLILLDNGNAANGDSIANDGIYSAVVPGSKTKLPGQYVFEMTASGNTPLMGNFSRTEKSSALVRVINPVEENSEVAIDKDLLTPGQFSMVIVPADAFDNFLGPGFAREIEVTVNPASGITVGPITDPRQDGSYNLKLSGVPSGANPIVTVKAVNRVIFSKPLDKGDIPNRRFAVFGGVGGNFPHGDFNTAFDSGISTQVGFEFRFTNRISAEGTFGYDRFGFPLFDDLSLYRGSGNVKFYPVIGTFQVGVFGGGGAYHFTFGSGGSTRGGVNFGSVLEYRINTRWSIEGTYNFHNVFTPGSDTRFSTAQAGFRFRF